MHGYRAGHPCLPSAYAARSCGLLAVIGPSGASKSTRLNIIGCLDRPTHGTYHFDGIDIGALTDHESAGLRSCHIGFVFQSFHLLPHRSVLENVMLTEVYRRQSHHGRRQRALVAIPTTIDAFANAGVTWWLTAPTLSSVGIKALQKYIRQGPPR